MKVVIDIWGDENDQEHLARFIREWDSSSQSIVNQELANGFLVNIRRELAWGPEDEFDERPQGMQGFN